MKKILTCLAIASAFAAAPAWAQNSAVNAQQQQNNAYVSQKTAVIFDCTAPKAPAGWKTIILQLVKKDNNFTLFTSAVMGDNTIAQFATCDISQVAQNMFDLTNVMTAEDQKNWKVILLQAQPNRSVVFQALTQADVVRINSGKTQ